MQLSDVTAQLRTGEIGLTYRYYGYEDAVIVHPYKGVLTPEIMEVIKAHQLELLTLLALSDWNICMDVQGHRSYHKAALWRGGSYVTCEECHRIRKAHVPTDDDLVRADFIDFRT